MNRAALALAVALLCSATAFGQTTWTGSSSSNWGSASNWSGGVPTAGSDVVIPAGTPNAPSTTGLSAVACRDLTVQSGATLTIASGTTLDSFRNVTIGGSITSSGLLRLTGTMSANLGGSGGIGPNVEIAKTGGGSITLAGNLALGGNFTLTSGTFVASQSPSNQLTVGGSASFQGGTLAIFNVGIIDVAGNVTFSGTTNSTTSPTIRCAGNWTSNASFAPTGGLIVFDGTAPQSVAVAGTLPGVTVAVGASVTVSNLTTNGVLTVNGSLAVSGTLDANSDVLVPSGGSINLGSGTHTVGRSFTVAGSLAGSGLLILDGSSSGSLSSVGTIPNLRISKTSGSQIALAGNTAVAGNFTQISGTFVASQNPNHQLSVGGSASFQGGTLVIFNTGIIDVAGNVTFSGTSNSSTSPTIRCAGNWTSDASFAPTAGLIVFDGSAPQSVAVVGALPAVTVATGASVTASNLTTSGNLLVDGSLLVTGVLDANQDVTVSSSGSLNLGSGTHTVARSFNAAGSLTTSGTLILDGALTGSLSSASPLSNLQIAKSAGSQVTLSGNATVAGNFTQTSGGFTVSQNPNDQLSIAGSANFQGGTLSIFNIGVIDVAGNVNFSGTTVSGTTPTIRCAGTWSANSAFAPTSGIVELDGPSPSTIAVNPVGGTLNFATLAISNSTRTLATDLTLAAQTINIQPLGSLDVGSGRTLRVNRSGPTSLNVSGTLSVAASGTLAMGPQTTATISANGFLNLIGAAGSPAVIEGEAGGGYALTVNGTLAARDFVVREAGSAGLVISENATIATAPNHLQNGTFDFRAGAPSGSSLLTLRRNAPVADFDGCTFLNTPGASGVFNVTTSATSVPFGFTNWGGAFSGPSFENDPNGLIAWNLRAAPPLAFFRVLPGAELSEILWEATSQTNVTAFEVRRATSPSGPFNLAFVRFPGGPLYGIIDSPLTANQPVFYLLHALLSQGDRLLVGSGSTTPYSRATPANINKVGGNGTFTTIQAAINAATDPNSVVWVTPGTYASFSIGPNTPQNLRILGDGTGPVNINTSSGPIQITGVAASSGVELSNLNIGSPTTASNAIVISNCAAPVILDELTVACASTNTAISVGASQRTAIQRSNISGGTGLDVSAASFVAISRGSLSSLVTNASNVEMTALTPGSISATPSGSVITRGGIMPNISLPEFIPLSQPSQMTIEAAPNAPYLVLLSPRFGFLTGAFEMPVLIDSSNFGVIPALSTDPLGNSVFPFEVFPDASLLGFTYVVQIVVGDLSTGTFRLSNVESMVGIP